MNLLEHSENTDNFGYAWKPYKWNGSVTYTTSRTLIRSFVLSQILNFVIILCVAVALLLEVAAS
jgi:hypothetical protein